METQVKLGPWLTITGTTRLRTVVVDDVLYALTVHNDGSGGWVTDVGRGRMHRQAYVPGVVGYKEAERCASRWARRTVRGMVAS